MDWTEQDEVDFNQAMGESFAAAVCPPIPFEEASPHECGEAVRSVSQISTAVDATLARWPR